MAAMEFPHSIPSPSQLRALTRAELDALPYGVLQLSDDGTILDANLTEARRSGRRPEELRGLNFFRHVAPCAEVREFADRFRDGARRGRLATTFDFVYRVDGREEEVIVHLASVAPGHGFILATMLAPPSVA